MLTPCFQTAAIEIVTIETTIGHELTIDLSGKLITGRRQPPRDLDGCRRVAADAKQGRHAAPAADQHMLGDCGQVHSRALCFASRNLVDLAREFH
jgi:hypothetical protein